MAGEIQGSYVHGATVYALVRSRNAQIWNTATGALENYATANYSGYTIAATEQGTASAYYAANMPATVPIGNWERMRSNT